MTSLSPALFKAITGNYQLAIKAVFLEAWQRLKGIKKVFWAGFVLLILVMLGITEVLGLIVPLHASNWIKAWYAVLPLLFTIAMVFVSLYYLRNQSVNAVTALGFRKAWKPLVPITILFYFIHKVLFFGASLILSKLNIILPVDTLFYNHKIGEILFLSGLNLPLLVIALPYIYITTGIIMAMLLVLDQEVSLLQSIRIAFKSINQHFFKNLGLSSLAWLMLFSIIYIIKLGMVFFWIVGMISIGVSLLVALSLIGLLPMFTLITAIQYRQIFCDDNLL